MGVKYGASPWVVQFPKSRRLEFPRFAPGRTHASSDVVIVGGGLAGCFTAYALSAAGVSVVLLEAERIGSGGSSRGPGILQGEAATTFLELESRHGLRIARAMFEASRRAVLDLASTAKRLGIKAGIEILDAVRIVPPFGLDGKMLARDVTARRKAGLDAVLLRPAAAAREAAVERLQGGVRLHDWGQADPYRLLVGFAAAASERGAILHERSPVRRIKVKRRSVEVHTAGGVVAAPTVVVCTGEPTDLFRSLKRHVRFDERYIVVTEKLAAAVRKQVTTQNPVIITDTDAPPHLVRWTEDQRLIVAGGDQARTPPRAREKILVQRTGQLMYELLRLYPPISGSMPEFGCDLPVATTADCAMYAGPHRNFPRHLFAWATRHDPAQAFLASRILLRHVLGESTREDAYFAFTRGSV